MPIEGEYEPSTWGWVADQVERYEASGGTEANTLMDTGIPIIVMTTVGHKSGKVRKVPLCESSTRASTASSQARAGIRPIRAGTTTCSLAIT